MRKRTFQDRKFSQGDSNSDLFRANWDATFGEKEEEPAMTCLDCGAEHPHFCAAIYVESTEPDSTQLPSAVVVSESLATGLTDK